VYESFSQKLLTREIGIIPPDKYRHKDNHSHKVVVSMDETWAQSFYYSRGARTRASNWRQAHWRILRNKVGEWDNVTYCNFMVTFGTDVQRVSK